MKTIIAGALSAGLVLALTTAANADHTRRFRDYDGYSQKYPSATPRQLQNLRAYERGDYYELDSNAVPFGSRPWWDLKQRESGHQPRLKTVCCVRTQLSLIAPRGESSVALSSVRVLPTYEVILMKKTKAAKPSKTKPAKPSKTKR